MHLRRWLHPLPPSTATRFACFRVPDQYRIFLLCQKHVQEMGSLFLSKKKKDRTLLPPSHTNTIADIGLRYRHNKSQAPYRARLSTAREVLPYTNHKPRLKKAQLAKTNIPFNSYPIFNTNKCFVLKQEDFKAPKAYVAANQCSSPQAMRFLRKPPRFEV